MAPSADVAVVMPAFNAARFIGAAIDSVLAQTVRPREIIVADDGSTDATADAARRSSLVTVASGPHGGIGAALNRGVAAARSAYVAFLDADDLWAPSKLERQLERIERPGEAELVFGWMVNFITPERAGDLAARIEWSPRPMPGYVLGTLLTRRTHFDRVGLFEAGWRLGHFVDWCARAGDLGLRRALVPEVVLRRRIHGDNTSLQDLEARVDFARAAKAALIRRRGS